MGAKVSVATPSPASSATRGADSATRDAPIAAGSANGFSSAMSAAARAPAQSDAGSGQSSGNSGTGNTASAAKSGNTMTTASASSAPKSSGTEQTSSAAATGAEADASAIDSGTATADSKTIDKGDGKSRSASADSVPTDPATLALLLAASGMQIDGRIGTGQSAGDEAKAPAKDDNASVQAAAAGALAANLALASLSALGANPPGAGPTTGNTTSGSATAIPASLASALSADKPVLTILDSLAAKSTRNGQDATDSPLGQDRSASGDTTSLQIGSTTGPNGLPEMMRELAPQPLQTAGVERSIATPVSDRNWSQAVAAQVQWQVNNNVQSATLQLSPDHLGPLEVRIDVQPSQVNVSFTAAHPDTRSALEQSVPRLREILAGSGLTLGQTTVQQEARSDSHYRPSVARGPISETQSVDPVSVSAMRSLGLIDEYV